MRDYRDAKSMAHMLREELSSRKSLELSVAESLELIAHLFGAADWNTLSAAIKAHGPEEDATAANSPGSGPSFSRRLEATLFRTLQLGQERRLHETSIELLLLSLLEDADASAMLDAQRIDSAAIRSALLASLQPGGPPAPARLHQAPPSSGFQGVVQRAILGARASRDFVITGADLLVAILAEPSGAAAELLRKHGLTAPR
jgi:hypothetical protein